MLPVRHLFNNALIRLTSAAARLSQQRVLQKYEDVAVRHPEQQNPVIVIPGVLGSRLVDSASGRSLWGGSSKHEFADPGDPAQLRAICHPMRGYGCLSEAADSVEPAGAVHELKAKVLGFPLAVKAYGPIIEMFGVTGFLKSRAASSISAEDDHEPAQSPLCFEFDYDWRRSVPDNAAELGRFIRLVREIALEIGHVGRDGSGRVDVVAHSMGGLLLRYFLRYGEQGLDPGGSPPELDWSGSRHVDRSLFVGVPNGGSAEAPSKLIRGLAESAAAPGYSSAVLGTMPSLYQLLPRARHETVMTASGTAVPDVLDTETWASNGWGLLDESNDGELCVLLPDASSRRERLRIATGHLAACLEEARRVQQALDRRGDPPEHVRKHLFAGDGVMTPSRVVVDADRNVDVVAMDDGDGTVLRSSALLDERIGGRQQSMLRSPIEWASVTFIPTDHMMLTCHPTFINNALYQILEDPTPHPAPDRVERIRKTAVATTRAAKRVIQDHGI